ncbi:MAG: hypothetical protein A3C36_06505 [Omnitrophica WOR_2 bacterium RIFCSPHIGHO2_02_FULL_52_10]|nr:MAG: hypothetical protein A3C36_06505 [Omnitrophica WOR_2 bacterium RIFCSPHIGHO2_02_FULL_52_10]
MSQAFEKFKPLAPLFLRFGLGMIFLYHGVTKIFAEGTSLGFSWSRSGLPTVIQALVAWGEFLGGIACLTGFMTEIASCGIIVIMLGAILTVHGKNGFNMMNRGFEYNFALIIMALTLIALGPGNIRIGGKGKK